MQRFFPVFLMLLLVLSFSGCITQSPESILEERRLRTAVRIHPEHEMGYLRLAQFLENQRRYAETLYVLKQGQQRVPDSLLMVRLEGSLYQSQDDKERSRLSMKISSCSILKKPSFCWTEHAGIGVKPVQTKHFRILRRYSNLIRKTLKPITWQD